MPSQTTRYLLLTLALLAVITAQAQDLHIKKSISVGGNFVSSSEVSIKGARERTVSQGPTGNTITLRQCDLKRTVTLNDQAQSYFVENDPVDENAAKAAALATGIQQPTGNGGTIVVTTTVTDTGERKTMYGFPARHLKAKVTEEPSKDACTQVHRSFEIDGWFADIAPQQAACATLAPSVQQSNGCQDTVVTRRVGSGKPGYALQEGITIPNPDGTKTTVGIQISEISKQELPAELFDVPAGYRQVKSLAELNGLPPGMQQAAAGGSGDASPFPVPKVMGPGTVIDNRAYGQQMANTGLPVANQLASQYGIHTPVTPGVGAQPAGAPVAAPQALGAKAPGRIRIGVAPPDAQVGQGNNAAADYSTPIRNAMVALMSGPAVEIAALDARVPMQAQAEAQQKQCDFVLFSSVDVKHNSGGGFGRFMKMAAPVASMVPMAGMGRGVGGAVAAQAAGAAASAAAMSAQQQAMNQLSGFNGQIKSKDNVTIQYQLVPAGQYQAVLQNSLQGKAKSDGEDVLTPLLQQTAKTVLSQVTKK